MSRIASDELLALDIEWYGIDRHDNVAVFCSAGQANIPEFVCADKERYEQLIELFKPLPPISEVQLCFECSTQNNLPLQVAEEFSKKGLFYFDSDDHSKAKDNLGKYQKYYTISSKPTTPIKYTDLPKRVQELLKDSFLPVDDFQETTVIEVEDAYNR